MKKTILQIQGMHCVSCKRLIEDLASDCTGLVSSNIDFETGEMTINHDESLDLDKLKKEIEGLGEYKVL